MTISPPSMPVPSRVLELEARFGTNRASLGNDADAFIFGRTLDTARADEEGGRWEPPANVPDPSDRLLREELGRRVAGEVAALPETFREPVVLRDVEGLSYEEIAEVIDVPVGTVRSRIHRGRLLLRERLADVVGGS